MPEKQFKQICECKNCGNEAEMVVTCTLDDAMADSDNLHVVAKGQGATKGHAKCMQCGNEADIWLDT